VAVAAWAESVARGMEEVEGEEDPVQADRDRGVLRRMCASVAFSQYNDKVSLPSGAQR